MILFAFFIKGCFDAEAQSPESLPRLGYMNRRGEEVLLL